LVAAAAQGLFLLTQSQLRWMLRPSAYFLVSLVAGAANLGLAVALVSRFGLGVHGILYGQVVGATLGTLLALALGRDTYGFELDPKALRRMLSFSLPLVPSGCGVLLSLYVDRLVIRETLGMGAVGVSGVAYRFA